MADKPLVIYVGTYTSARKRVRDILVDCGALMTFTHNWKYFILYDGKTVDVENYMPIKRSKVDFIDARFLRNRRKRK